MLKGKRKNRTLDLTQGKITTVSLIDFKYLSKFNWHTHSKGYACRQAPRNKGKRTLLLMHRVILERIGFDLENEIVDHINRNKLDNRRENLRIVNATQSNFNRGLLKNNKSGIIGVFKCSYTGKWRSQIGFKKKSIHLGRFSDKDQAKLAYDKARSIYVE